MPTYATRSDCLEYTAGLVVEDNAEFDKLIERAEDDIDGLLGNLPLDPVTERKLVPADLTTAQLRAIRRATCAQVEYRIEMGEAFFVRGQYDKAAGPDFSREGKLPYIGPKVKRELKGAFGISRTQTARARA